VTALETAMKNKKDMKPEHEAAIKTALKQAAEANVSVKESVTKAVLETRFKILEVEIQKVLAIALASRR